MTDDDLDRVARAAIEQRGKAQPLGTSGKIRFNVVLPCLLLSALTTEASYLVHSPVCR